MQLGETHKELLADFGENFHLGKINGRYVLLIEEDMIEFEKGVSPIEFHKPVSWARLLKSLLKEVLESKVYLKILEEL
jgi:hypothetical protein